MKYTVLAPPVSGKMVQRMSVQPAKSSNSEEVMLKSKLLSASNSSPGSSIDVTTMPTELQLQTSRNF